MPFRETSPFSKFFAWTLITFLMSDLLLTPLAAKITKDPRTLTDSDIVDQYGNIKSLDPDVYKTLKYVDAYAGASNYDFNQYVAAIKKELGTNIILENPGIYNKLSPVPNVLDSKLLPASQKLVAYSAYMATEDFKSADFNFSDVESFYADINQGLSSSSGGWGGQIGTFYDTYNRFGAVDQLPIYKLNLAQQPSLRPAGSTLSAFYRKASIDGLVGENGEHLKLPDASQGVQIQGWSDVYYDPATNKGIQVDYFANGKVRSMSLVDIRDGEYQHIDYSHTPTLATKTTIDFTPLYAAVGSGIGSLIAARLCKKCSGFTRALASTGGGMLGGATAISLSQGLSKGFTTLSVPNLSAAFGSFLGSYLGERLGSHIGGKWGGFAGSIGGGVAGQLATMTVINMLTAHVSAGVAVSAAAYTVSAGTVGSAAAATTVAAGAAGTAGGGAAGGAGAVAIIPSADVVSIVIDVALICYAAYVLLSTHKCKRCEKEMKMQAALNDYIARDQVLADRITFAAQNRDYIDYLYKHSLMPKNLQEQKDLYDAIIKMSDQIQKLKEKDVKCTNFKGVGHDAARIVLCHKYDSAHNADLIRKLTHTYKLMKAKNITYLLDTAAHKVKAEARDYCSKRGDFYDYVDKLGSTQKAIDAYNKLSMKEKKAQFTKLQGREWRSIKLLLHSIAGVEHDYKKLRAQARESGASAATKSMAADKGSLLYSLRSNLLDLLKLAGTPTDLSAVEKDVMQRQLDRSLYFDPQSAICSGRANGIVASK